MARRPSLGSRLLLSGAGTLGALGVGVGAAAAHGGGGELGLLASQFLLFHAAGVAALAAYAAAVPASSVIMLVCGTALILGTAAFSGDLALVAFRNVHLVRGLAPVGGLLLIAGWIGLIAAPWLIRASRGADWLLPRG